MATAKEGADHLRGLYPRGVERVLDWDDEPGEFTDALGATLAQEAFSRGEQLPLELTPLTCTDLLPWWERALKIRDSKIALSGTRQQRINQVLSRLRERGPMTVAKIQRVIAPLLDYADSSQLQVLQADRVALRVAHTRTVGGVRNFTGSLASYTINVLDRAKVSKGGAQVDLTLSALADISRLVATLIAPDGRTRTVTKIGRGAGPGVWRLFYPTHFGAQVAGVWTLQLSTSDGSAGTATGAALFVEGIGRESGLDGLGAAIFYWAAVADPALMGPNADLDAAKAAVRRINHATRNGSIVRASTVAGEVCVVPDEPAAIPDECIPC
jgi:hypothetical protein